MKSTLRKTIQMWNKICPLVMVAAYTFSLLCGLHFQRTQPKFYAQKMNTSIFPEESGSCFWEDWQIPIRQLLFPYLKHAFALWLSLSRVHRLATHLITNMAWNKIRNPGRDGFTCWKHGLRACQTGLSQVLSVFLISISLSNFWEWSWGCLLGEA